jgi:hypothetical protein
MCFNDKKHWILFTLYVCVRVCVCTYVCVCMYDQSAAMVAVSITKEVFVMDTMCFLWCRNWTRTWDRPQNRNGGFFSTFEAQICHCRLWTVKVKVKVTLDLAMRARGGGEWRYSSNLSLSSALDGGGWLTPIPGRFIPGKETRVQEAGWAPGPVWTGAEKSRRHRASIPGPSSP